MKNMKFVVAGVLLLGLCLGIDVVEKQPTYRTETQMFLTDLADGRVERVARAYDTLLRNSPLKKKKDAVDNLKVQTSAAMKLYGKSLGIGFIKEQRYGDSIVRLLYILKFEQLPLAWEFYYYKSETEWQLVNIQFKDDLDLLADK